MTLRREEHTGRIKLRQPDHVPNGLIRELKRFFEKSMEVKSAWLTKAREENEPDEHWMLLIDFYGEKIKLFPQVAEIMKVYMQPGEKFELIQRKKEFDTKEIEPARIYTRISNTVLS